MESLYKFRDRLFRKYVIFFVVLVGAALLASRLSEVYIDDTMLRTAVLLILGLVLSVLASLVVARELADVHAALTEVLEQQTATSEILRVISSSPTDLQPVFDTIIRSAVRLCHGLAAHLRGRHRGAGEPHGFLVRRPGELLGLKVVLDRRPFDLLEPNGKRREVRELAERVAGDERFEGRRMEAGEMAVEQADDVERRL